MMNMTEVILTEMDLVVIEMVEMTDLTGTIAMTTDQTEIIDQIEIIDIDMIQRRGNLHRNHILVLQMTHHLYKGEMIIHRKFLLRE